MASPETGRLNNYLRNKGDICRNNVLDPRFECPICLTCLKNPYLTTCGHRFCKDCILQWLKHLSVLKSISLVFEGEGSSQIASNLLSLISSQDVPTSGIEKEGGCPLDGKIMSQDKDLFPDNYTRREIAHQTMECPFPGCEKVLPLLETENHVLEVHEKAVADVELEIHCPFKSIGCTELFTSQNQLVQHTHRCMSQHLQMLTIAHNKLSQQIPSCNGEDKEKEAALWDPPPKHPPDHFDTPQALIKSLYEKIVILEQRATEQEVQLKNAKDQLTKLLAERQSFEANLALRICNGTYVWNLSDMRSKLTTFYNDPTYSYYSEGFYTSYSGYKFCARIHISTNLKYISLLIHLMKGENDYALSWPFSGRIAFKLIHPTLPDVSVCEVMCSRPDSEAFKRPTKVMNSRGFGYSEFILIEHLSCMQFYNDDGSVNIRIQVTCV